MATNLPLTVESALAVNFNLAVCVGPNAVQPPSQPGANSYWFVVLDRTNLNVVFNYLTQSYNSVPSGLAPDNTDGYILVLTTIGLGTLNVPQGALYTFLDQSGGGAQLASLAQISSQLGCGEINTVAYNLVTVLGGGSQGLEASMLQSSDITGQNWVGYIGGPGPIQTLTLLATTVNGGTMYTPITLQD